MLHIEFTIKFTTRTTRLVESFPANGAIVSFKFTQNNIFFFCFVFLFFVFFDFVQVNSDTAIYMSFDQLIDSKEVMKVITAEVDEKGKKKKIALQLLTPEEVQASKIPSNFPLKF